ncbi:MAG: hypothetical protein IJS45_10315, partial [Clostridia bacterium]|nr:hypothetical protein [Clostridia bacterium]
YTETGIKTYTCTECGATKTEDIPVLDPLPGDVNGDKKLNSRDISVMKRCIASSLEEDDVVITVNADINGDGKINSRDLSALKRLIAG